MCFSATASFVTAGVTGIIGIASLMRASDRSQLLLAAVPVVFGTQQVIEGLLWLNLPMASDRAGVSTLTLLFLLFAEVFWPVYMPLAVLLIEPDARRRTLMLPWLALGAAVATYLAWGILARPLGASILGEHVVYVTDNKFSFAAGVAYVGVIAIPFVLSTQRIIGLFGTVVLAGWATAYFFYWEALVSVWCFFAAAASTVILLHFEKLARYRVAAGTG